MSSLSNIQAPSKKVGAGALASALTVLIVWAVQTFTVVDVPVPVAGAIATVVYFLVGYFVKDEATPVTPEPAPPPSD